MMTDFQIKTDARPHKRWLTLARVVWLSIALLDVGLFVLGLAVWLPLLEQPCTEITLVCQQRGQFTAADFAALNAMSWSWQVFVLYQVVNQLAVKMIGPVVGFLIFWRKPNDRMAWVASLFLVIGLETSIFDTLTAAQPALWLLTSILSYIGIICFGLFFYLFPNGQFVPRWTRWLAAAWGLVFFFTTFFPQSPLDLNQSGELAGLVGGSFFVSFIVAQVYRYVRVSNGVERVQTKWVVFALVFGIILFLGSLFTVLASPDRSQRISQYWYLTGLGFSALSYLLPIAIGTAILRYRLFDIDILIRKTVTYTLVVALLAIVYFGSVILLQQLFANVTGQRSEVITVLSTLAIAALFVPLRNRIQEMIDKRFYRKKYDAQKVLEKFAETVRDETDIDKLTAELVNVVQETMQPKSVSVWLKKDGGSK